MKIAVIFHDSNYYSGATHSMCDICDSWLLDGSVELVAVFPNEGSAPDYLRHRNIPVICSYYWEMRRHSDETLFYSFTRWPLREKLMIQSFTNTRKYIYPFLLKENIDALYCNTASSCVGAWLKKWLNKPLVYHIREFGVEDQGFLHFHGEKWFNRKLEKADRIIVISKSLEEKYKELFPLKRISMIYNDVSEVYKNPSVHDWTGTITIMSCGAFIAGKGHIEVIKACEIVKNKGYDIKLLLVGNNDTKYGEFIESYIENNSLGDFVQLTGMIKEMNKLRQNVNIGIVASTKEAFGRITIEGMLSKLVMIGADTGATPELINHMQNGILYNHNSIQDLADKICWCIDNINTSMSIADNAYTYSLEFCKGNCAKKILGILGEL